MKIMLHALLSVTSQYIELGVSILELNIIMFAKQFTMEK